MQPSNVVALPAFGDNDIRLLHDGTQAVVVEPGDAEPVSKALERLRLKSRPDSSDAPSRRERVHHMGSVDAARTRPSPLQPWKNELQ